MPERPLQISIIPKKELERAQFVGANLDEISDPVEILEREDLAAQVRTSVSGLPGREKTVINQRFPQVGERFSTQEQIGKQFGVSRGRIHQIEQKALRRLRKSPNSDRIVGYGTNHELNEQPAIPTDEDIIRMYLNGIVNACYIGDAVRARRNLALAKAKLVFIRDFQVEERVIQALADPEYERTSKEVLEDYLKRFTTESEAKNIVNGIRQIEKSDSLVPREIRRFESMVRKLSEK